MRTSRRNQRKKPTESPRKKILLVDDEPGIASLLQRILTEAGYKVRTASTGRQGLSALAKDKSIGLALIDLKLPDMSGIELIEKAKEKDSRAKPVIITAFGDSSARRKAKREGAVDFLDKPFRLERVFKLAASACGFGQRKPHHGPLACGMRAV